MSLISEEVKNIYDFLNIKLPENGTGCEWDKITCSEDNQNIISLNISETVTTGLNFSNFPILPKLLRLEINGHVFNNTVLPSILFELPKLEELIIVKSNLSEFPKIINFNSTLHQINISHNKFKEFPLMFKDLINLNEINISHNCIMGEIYIPKHATIIDISNNNITKIITENTFYQITELYLKNNNFNSNIFDTLIYFSNLNIIDLSDNRQIKEIPSSIQHLKSLNILRLSNSSISSISENFYKLSKLKTLALDNNPDLKVKIKNFPSKIKHCYFKNSPIKCIYPNTCDVIEQDNEKFCTNISERNHNILIGSIIFLCSFILVITLIFVFTKKGKLLHNNDDIIITNIKRTSTRKFNLQNNTNNRETPINSDNINAYISNSSNHSESSHSLTHNDNSHNSVLLSYTSSNNEIPTLTYLASLSDANDVDSNHDILPSYMELMNNYY